MKNLKNILITLIILISAPLIGAERPPQPQRLPTFLETVKQEEERQLQERKQAIAKRRENLAKQKAEVEELRKKVAKMAEQNFIRKLERSSQQAQAKVRQESMVSLQGLPAELQTPIFSFLAVSDQPLDIEALAKKLLALAGTSKGLYAAINNPANMIAILDALPYHANAKDLADMLCKKPITMPVMQNQEVQNWLTRAWLTKGWELYQAARSNDIKAVEKLLTLKNIDLNWMSREGHTAIALARGMQRTAGAQNAKIIYLMLLRAGANPRKGKTPACTIL